mmetsp:Transcript_37393/g.78864  ORF Transcript_37393/g.78864 Transcript_37393/m.78864 type:complete len:757 (+) Transcript_37393:35-2305(+)
MTVRKMMRTMDRIMRTGMMIWALLLQPNNYYCKAQTAGVLEDLSDDMFVKDPPPTAPPNSGNTPSISASPTSTPSSPPSKSPMPGDGEDDNLPPATVVLNGHNSCSFSRDTYCQQVAQENIDLFLGVNATAAEKEAILRNSLKNELGISYEPLVDASVNYWMDNATDKKAGWKGYSVREPSQLYKVNAYAVGLMIQSLSNIDSIKGTFDATLRIYFFNITEGPFDKVSDAVNTIYKDDSKTTSTRVRGKNDEFYRLNEESFPNAWAGGRTEKGEFIHPDGICTAKAMASMQPIKADEDFVKDLMRFPGSMIPRIWPNYMHDENGDLSNVELTTTFKFRPLNRRYYPFQRDLLDIDLEMAVTNLIHKDQPIVQNLFCLHPSYSGFTSHVFGADVGAGHGTSDSLIMVPRLDFDRVEPFLIYNKMPQFFYDEDNQTARYGNGTKVQRTISLRIIVEHPTSKGFYEIFPLLFVSLTAVANFISSNPYEIGATSMVQVLLGINTLVTQNTQWIGQNTNMASALWLAYAVNGLWIFTVVFMTVINRERENEDSRKKWYIVYQNKIFRYLRLLAASLCLLYLPLMFISSDENSGYQQSKTWVWILVVVFICVMFAVRALFDYRKIKQKRAKQEVNAMKEFSDISKFQSKPVADWDEDEVVRWITIGSMHKASYFTDNKRSSIGDKLTAACVDGKLLCHYGKDFEVLVEKFVEFVGLPFGDAMKLAEEVTILLDNLPKVESACVLFQPPESNDRVENDQYSMP